MKISAKFLCLVLLINIPNLNAQNVFNEKIDSLLVSIDELILNDLSKDSTIVSMRPWGLGESYKFEVIFKDNRSIVLRYLNRPEFSDPKKPIVTKHRFKLVVFRSYINDHKELPYSKIDYLRYQFLLLQKKGETFGEAMFGEYKIKATPEGLTIMGKKLEILTGEKSILEKHNSVW